MTPSVSTYWRREASRPCPQEITCDLPRKSPQDHKCEAQQTRTVSFSAAALVIGIRQAVLFDPREPLPFPAHTWVRAALVMAEATCECALPTRTGCHTCLASATHLFVTRPSSRLLLGPFTFFDVQKTKYLQILTSLMRWIGESDKHLEVCLAPLIPSLPQTSRGARSQRQR